MIFKHGFTAPYRVCIFVAGWYFPFASRPVRVVYGYEVLVTLGDISEVYGKFYKGRVAPPGVILSDCFCIDARDRVLPAQYWRSSGSYGWHLVDPRLSYSPYRGYYYPDLGAEAARRGTPLGGSYAPTSAAPRSGIAGEDE